LKKINSAAKKIASGKFDERLDISSEDEIGELARSLTTCGRASESGKHAKRFYRQCVP